MRSKDKIEWMELQQVAEKLNQCRRSIKSKISQGLFTVAKDEGSNKIYFKIEEINKYIESKVIIKKAS